MRSLKIELSLYISLIFTLLFGLGSVSIYLLFESHRQEEFRGRLSEKALTTAKLLLEVKDIDQHILKIIDYNTIKALYDEKTLVFNDSFHLIYSSIDDAVIDYDLHDLKRLKQEGSFFKHQDGRELFGVFYDFENVDYYVLVLANDKYGKSKAQHLLFVLLEINIICLILVLLLSYYWTGRLLKPLLDFRDNISHITARNLTVQLAKVGKIEIDDLIRSFNRMLWRLEQAFNLEKEFAANASHELRTPIARLMVRLDNLRLQPELSDDSKNYCQEMATDLQQMSEIISSLLLLSKGQLAQDTQLLRLDECILWSYEKISANHPQFQMNLEMAQEEEFELKAQRHIIEILLDNLLRNACLYASDYKVWVKIEYDEQRNIVLSFKNRGAALDLGAQQDIFKPFSRGKNSSHIKGHGLGLSIAKRIMDYHHGEIVYRTEAPDWHIFELVFPSSKT
jgi:signal transduction histidine kinase